jgi:hypothetical protein
LAFELLSALYLIAWQAIGNISRLVIASLLITAVSAGLIGASLFVGAGIETVAIILVATGIINSVQRVTLIGLHHQSAFLGWLLRTVVATIPVTAVVLALAQVPAFFLEQGLARLAVIFGATTALLGSVTIFNLRKDGINLNSLIADSFSSKTEIA